MTLTDTRPEVLRAVALPAAPTPPEIPLPDAARDVLLACGAQRETAWRSVALLLDALIQDREREHGATSRLGQMRLYADAAALVGVRSSTVRGWLSVWRAVGEDVIEEFAPLTFAHWRLIVAQMRATGRTAPDLAAAWLATSDGFAGLVVPPDVMAARLADDDAEPAVTRWERALERLQKALVAALRCAPEGAAPELAQVSAALARLEEAT